MFEVAFFGVYWIGEGEDSVLKYFKIVWETIKPYSSEFGVCYGYIEPVYIPWNFRNGPLFIESKIIESFKNYYWIKQKKTSNRILRIAKSNKLKIIIIIALKNPLIALYFKAF